MNIGDIAPDIELFDSNGSIVKLSDFRGRKVVLYFYPKDNTPGCTRQACAFADNYAEYKKRNIDALFASLDICRKALPAV